MTITEKITNKENQIKKLVAKYDKYSKLVSEEFLSLCNQFLRTGDRTAIREYTVRVNPTFKWLNGADEDLYRTTSDLFDARNTLEKYLIQAKAEADKQATLSELPYVLVEFKNNLVDRWNKFDEWKYNEIRKEYREIKNMPYGYEQCRAAYKDMNSKWGRNWYDFAYHYTLEDAFNNNRRDANNLVLNLVNRTVELCGQITDCSDLHLDQDNAGYLIINGTVHGTFGSARVESVGAGGYNIQRYHIRVLVKPVKQ